MKRNERRLKTCAFRMRFNREDSQHDTGNEGERERERERERKMQLFRIQVHGNG